MQLAGERDELRGAVATVKKELADATAKIIQLAGERDELRGAAVTWDPVCVNAEAAIADEMEATARDQDDVSIAVVDVEVVPLNNVISRLHLKYMDDEFCKRFDLDEPWLQQDEDAVRELKRLMGTYIYPNLGEEAIAS